MEQKEELAKHKRTKRQIQDSKDAMDLHEHEQGIQPLNDNHLGTLSKEALGFAQ